MGTYKLSFVGDANVYTLLKNGTVSIYRGHTDRLDTFGHRSMCNGEFCVDLLVNRQLLPH
jgi:hypothetical protein